MHRNAIWVVFLILVVMVAIWFFVKAGYDLVSYSRLSVRVPVKVEKWEVQEAKEDAYFIVAHYTFTFDEKEYHGVGAIGKSYPNPWAAEKSLKKISQRSWSVWINPKDPERTVFEKKFPFKSVVSAVILLALALYFFCLGFFVGGKIGKSH